MKRYVLLLLLLLGFSINFTYKHFYSGNGFVCEKYPSAIKNKFRDMLVNKTQEILPSPHSELLAGFVLGSDLIKTNEKFYDYLKKTGTVHVVVVSGFNISIMLTIFSKIIGEVYNPKNTIVLILTIVVYSVFTGFEPPVIRACIMGSIAYVAKSIGRSASIIYLLFLSGTFMLIFDEQNLCSLSFWLSFLATLSLVTFEPIVASFIGLFFKAGVMSSDTVLFQDLKATIAASVLVWPVISYFFGTVSLLSPLVNMLSLWIVPISTVLGLLFFILLPIFKSLAFLVSMIIYPFLEYFVILVNYFGSLRIVSISVTIMPWQIVLYYSVCFCIYLKFSTMSLKSEQV